MYSDENLFREFPRLGFKGKQIRVGNSKELIDGEDLLSDQYRIDEDYMHALDILGPTNPNYAVYYRTARDDSRYNHEGIFIINESNNRVIGLALKESKMLQDLSEECQEERTEAGDKRADVVYGTTDDDELGSYNYDHSEGNLRIQSDSGVASGCDELRGGSGNDRLNGTWGRSNVLRGGEGDDRLMGSKPQREIDIISIGMHNQEIDRLEGGPVQDQYVLGDKDETYYLDSRSNYYALIEDIDLGNAQEGDDYDGDQIVLSSKDKGDYGIGWHEGEVAIFVGDNLVAVVKGAGDREGVRDRLDKDLNRDESIIFKVLLGILWVNRKFSTSK